uniref:Glycosyl transferase family 1 domain-containing protein n=1 Tax=viral metagenome TaxID=1070528 RepID=A0A6C0KSB2_9ZZZZ
MYTIFFDITLYLQDGRKTGVPNTMYNFAFHFLKHSENKVEFLQLVNERFVTCHSLKETFSGLPRGSLGNDDVPVISQGDVLFLSNAIYCFGANGKSLFSLIKNGLCVIPFLHDIIPITHTEYSDCQNEFYPWIINMTNMKTGILCNSLFTVHSFLERFNYKYPIGYIHLGCNKDNLSFEEVSLPKGKNVLMVSTIEPRKMYDKTLEEFDRIWERRDDINLIIVGKKGWQVDKIMNRIETHPLRDKNLFNLSNLSDGQINFLYKNCDLFLFSSEVEGFGLGVIEAGRFGTPLLLRDIPVFKEIAGYHATYFDDFSKLPDIINHGFESGFKRSEGMKINSWDDTAIGCLKGIDGIRSRYLEKFIQQPLL